MLALFERHPALTRALAHEPLGDFPTPVQRLERLGPMLGTGELWLKNDGVSAREYGGNKIRKLELILGDARERGAREVLTFGYAGSNHALATTLAARSVGIGSISLLLPQANAHYVRRNLLAGIAAGAELHACRNLPAVVAATGRQMIRHRLATGRTPYVVAPGGSSPRGTIGYVNAGFELAGQIEAGELAAPAFVYVALGSMGTAVGLAIGLAAAGLPTRVVAVRVVDRRYASFEKALTLAEKTVALLRMSDASFPSVTLAPERFEVRDDQFGTQYARFTEQGVAAAALMHREEGFTLDGTYTGKALAALVHDASEGRLADERVLFWNTYNARDLRAMAAAVDYHLLPAAFHRYFEQPVQPLDETLASAQYGGRSTDADESIERQETTT
jgi:1-aminocyclopropane-1-carboxylate deaminase/D-cysteine desulfhydrase-like pyridoxal-dependent ACC family enzyme